MHFYLIFKFHEELIIFNLIKLIIIIAYIEALHLNISYSM